MSNEKKQLTITMTDRQPVKIIAEDWPVIAEGAWSDYDGRHESQANRKWKAWIKVRQHDDGRTIVYGLYDYETVFQGEHGVHCREGVLLKPDNGEYDAERGGYWISPRIAEAIHEVGNRLAERSEHDERSEHECWPDVIADTIADLPPEELT